MKFLSFVNRRKSALSHAEIRDMLVRIGATLGKYAGEEYREGFWQYDVAWKETAVSQRISHVFSVQDKDSLESGLANLKHLYDIQRSKTFLIIVDERDVKRIEDYLRPHLAGSFHEIADSMVILSGQDVQHIYRSLPAVRDHLSSFLAE